MECRNDGNCDLNEPDLCEGNNVQLLYNSQYTEYTQNTQIHTIYSIKSVIMFIYSIKLCCRFYAVCCSVFSTFEIVGFCCPLFMLWDFVLWDFVLWDFVHREFVLWDSAPDCLSHMHAITHTMGTSSWSTTSNHHILYIRYICVDCVMLHGLMPNSKKLQQLAS